MEIRFQQSPRETAGLNTDELRDKFLVRNIVRNEEVNLVYSHYDRMIIGGARPVEQTLELPNHPELRAAYFLERRELGIINVGGKGVVQADGNAYELHKLDALYLGKETKNVTFSALDPGNPPVFYLLSTPAHAVFPSRKFSKEHASPLALGDYSLSNKRTVYQYIHAGGIQSCQLVMGLTLLEEGNVWNSVPPHTHTRRMEVYFYFDLAAEHRVFHFMGEPLQTRHLVVANHEAVISPPWSVHFGSGTSHYGFIWGMAGENQAFADMDPCPIDQLR